MIAKITPPVQSKFGAWTVLGPDPEGDGKRWLVECKCGFVGTRLHRTLRAGTSTCCTRCASGGTAWYLSEKGRLPVPGVDIPPAPKCKKCGDDMATVNNKSLARGWSWRCRACQLAKKKEQYADPAFKQWHRQQATKRKCRQYGLTVDEAVTLWQSQGKACAICSKRLASPAEMGQHSKGTHIDHCHTTGKVRGVLCSCCNHAIGLMQDDVSRLQSAILYLKG